MGWIRVELSQEEELELKRCFKSSSDRRLRDRCQAVLMAAEGRSKTEIARDLCVVRESVTNWLKLYMAGGLQGLVIQWGPGREPLIPETLAPEIIDWVKKGPSGCGLERANWTYEELAEYLFQQKGIRVGEWAMRQFCKRHDIRPYRPTYQYLRGDPVKQEKAREELKELKKRPKPVTLCC